MTIYDTISTFFQSNKDDTFTRKQIYKKFKVINKDSLHTTMIHLARDKKIVPIHPRKWQWNSETR